MKLTIRAKMVATFGLTLFVLVLAVAAVGWWSMTTSSVRLEKVYEGNLQATVYLAEAQDTLWRLQYAFPQFLVMPDERGKIRADESGLIQVANETMSAYAEQALTAEERQGLREWSETWPQYTSARARWFDLVAAGKAAEAAQWRAQTTTPMGVALVNTLAKLIKVQRSAAKTGVHAEVVGARTAMAAALGAVILAAMVVGAGLVLAIGRRLTGPLATAAEVLESVARGDFTRQLVLDRRDEVGRMASALNRAVDGVRTALVEVQVAARQSTLASQEVAEAAQQLAGRAQEQAASLEETAASLEEMSGTVKQNATHAGEANRLAVDARTVAEKGGRVASAAVGAMAEINSASRRIADIIGTIDEIAFQTNLLALNAAVEAARAGEQGRGFAVVASEVRNLAQRSAEAAKEIKGLIHDTTSKVEAGTALVNQAGQTLEEIVQAAKRVTDVVTEIAAAGREQSSGIDQVNRAIVTMDQLTQSSAAQTEDLSATAQALAVQAEQLQALVARFVLQASDESARTGASVAPAPVATPAAATPTAVRPVAPPRGAPRPGRRAPATALAATGKRNGANDAADDGFEEF
jgi:methyl-accepting chemotaxis protein